MNHEENQDSVWNKAESLCSLGRLEAAISLLERVAEGSENVVEKSSALAKIGNILEQDGQTHAAFKMYRQGLQVWSDCPFSRMGLARWLLAHGETYRNKEKAYELIHEIDHLPVPGVHIMRGLMLMRGTGCKKDLDAAQTSFLKGYRYGNLIALRLVGKVLWKKNQYMRALCIEIKASGKILPIYFKDSYDQRIRIF